MYCQKKALQKTGTEFVVDRSDIGKTLIAAMMTLTLGACGGEGGGSVPPSPGDTPDIEAAGEFRLLDEHNHADPSKPPTVETDIPISDNVTAMCTTEGWTASEVREISNTVGLDLSGTQIYPGALLQGSNYEDGRYVPITIPRAPGTIYMTGLTLDQGAQYYANDIPMSGSRVNQSIKELLTDYQVDGTAANASYQESQTYSYENMLFELGIDARYGSFNMEADLGIETTNTRNYTFVKFTQVFYDIVFEDPELATSVFRDGANFRDPEGQIGSGNPPLYVSKVSYGRMIFFVAESTHDAREVEVALSAAVRGGVASGTVDSGLTYKEVMEKTQVYYYVVGGGADLALAPIASADQTEMFQAVKSFISNRDAANFSPENPGAPIAYTLNYLKDRTPARMSYTVNYDKKDCEFFETAAPPPPPNDFKLEISGVMGSGWVVVNDRQCGAETSSTKTVNLNRCMRSSGKSDIEVVLDRGGWCGEMNLDFEFKVNGRRKHSGSYHAGPCVFGARYFHWYFTVDRATGAVTGVRDDD